MSPLDYFGAHTRLLSGHVARHIHRALPARLNGRPVSRSNMSDTIR
jgi:hypothetical protein